MSRARRESLVLPAILRPLLGILANICRFYDEFYYIATRLGFFLNGPFEKRTNLPDPNSTKVNFGPKTDQTDHRVDETLGIERIRSRRRRFQTEDPPRRWRRSHGFCRSRLKLALHRGSGSPPIARRSPSSGSGGGNSASRACKGRCDGWLYQISHGRYVLSRSFTGK